VSLSRRDLQSTGIVRPAIMMTVCGLKIMTFMIASMDLKPLKPMHCAAESSRDPLILVFKLIRTARNDSARATLHCHTCVEQSREGAALSIYNSRLRFKLNP
jgi:hypothetical protein